MRQVTLLSAFWLLSFTLNAQLQNYGFEQWKNKDLFPEPLPFVSNNYLMLFNFPPSATLVPGVVGNALRIETLTSNGAVFPAGMGTAADYSNMNIGGVPFTSAPDSVSIDLRFSIPAGDTGFVRIGFRKSGNLIGFYNQPLIGSQAQFTTHTFDLGNLAQTPDTMAFGAIVGLFGNAQAGGWIEFDQLIFHGAQDIFPNANFENMGSYKIHVPEGLMSNNIALLDRFSPGASQVRDSESGCFAVHLKSQPIFFGSFDQDTVSAFSNGNLNLVTGFFNDGDALNNQIPDNFSGYFKSNPVANDSAVLYMLFTAFSTERDTLMEITHTFPPASNYTHFEVPITLPPGMVPDTILWVFGASNIFDDIPNQIGSELFLDRLRFNYDTSTTFVADAGPDICLCDGDSARLGSIDPTQGGQGPFQYLWSPAGGLSDPTDSNPSVYITAATTYTLRVTDDTGAVAFDSVLVRPNLPISVVLRDDTTICLAAEVLPGKGASTSGGSGVYTFNWTPDADLNNGSILDPIGSFQEAVTLYLSLSDHHDCSASDSINIQTFPEMRIDAGADTGICSEDTVVLGGTPSAEGGVPPLTYSWSGSDSLSSMSAANPYAFPYQTTTLNLEVSDSAGCTESDSVVILASHLSIDAGVSTILSCPGDTLQLGGAPTASNTIGRPSFLWTPTNELDDSSASNPILVTSLPILQMRLQVSDSSGCSMQASIFIANQSMSQITCPDDTTICDGAIAHYAAPAVTDRCDGFTVSQSTGIASGQSFPLGSTINEFTVTSSSGLTSSCSFSVHVGTAATSAGTDKISSTTGGFNSSLEKRGEFGKSIAYIGDLNGDGFEDMLVGNPMANPIKITNGKAKAVKSAGAVWILFLNSDQTVIAQQKISIDSGGLPDTLLQKGERFGSAVSSIGDVNGDGISDLVVGASGYLSYNSLGKKIKDAGAIYILYMNTDGTVQDHQRIAMNQGGFTRKLYKKNQFGSAISDLGDVNGDGLRDLAVGSAFDSNEEGTEKLKSGGAVYLLMLEYLGLVNSHSKINGEFGGLTTQIKKKYAFGSSVAALGDINGDLVPDLLVGAPGGNGINASTNQPLKGVGGVVIVHLDNSGKSVGDVYISEGESGLAAGLNKKDAFGSAVTAAGDLNFDGTEDILVGAPNDDEVDKDGGAIHIVFLNDNGSALNAMKVNSQYANLAESQVKGDKLGSALTAQNSICFAQVATGVIGDDDHSNPKISDAGAVWFMTLPDNILPKPMQMRSIETNLAENSNKREHDLPALALSNEVSIYPNPSNDIFNVAINSESDDYIIYRLFNGTGVLINQGVPQTKKWQLNLGSLIEGIYILQIVEGYSNHSYKLVKR